MLQVTDLQPWGTRPAVWWDCLYFGSLFHPVLMKFQKMVDLTIKFRENKICIVGDKVRNIHWNVTLWGLTV